MKRRSALIALAATLAGCGGGGSDAPEPTATKDPAPAAPDPAPSIPESPAPETAPPAPPPPLTIAAWGDSLTDDYSRRLQTLIPGSTVFHGGVGAQLSTQIAARQGGVVPLMRVQGDTIPAAGSVQIVSQSVAMHNSFGPGAITGTLAGVPGSVVRNADGTFTFTRTTSGDAMSISADEPFLVDTFGRRAWPTIFCYGRNNIRDPQQILNDLAASIAFLEPGNTKWLVLSVLNYAGETLGTGGYEEVRALNSALAAKYPANFFDIRAYLVASYDPALAQDVLDHQNDVTPTSLRRDTLHMNKAGSVVMATGIKKAIEAKGW
jgi:lysophospholipase L1-like esterase